MKQVKISLHSISALPPLEQKEYLEKVLKEGGFDLTRTYNYRLNDRGDVWIFTQDTF